MAWARFSTHRDCTVQNKARNVPKMKKEQDKNQNDAAEVTAENDQRDHKGRFLPGNKVAVGHYASSWQPYKTRLQKWLDMPSNEFNRIATSPSEIKKLSMIDVVCVRHVANMIKGNDVRLERQQMLERVEGKITDKTELSGPDGGDIPLTTNTTELAQEGKNALAFLLQRMVDEQKKNKTEK